MPGDPDAYLERNKDEFSEANYQAVKEFREKADIADSTIYDYISRLKNILQKASPEGFELSNPTQEEITEIANNISKLKDNASTEKTWKKSVKKFYNVYQNGEYYDLTGSFTLSGKNRTVEPDMILSPQEVEDIVNQCNNSRNKAYIRLLYETATTPGELLDAKLQDVDLNEETIYIRGNKGHESQKMELHNEGLHHLREWLRMHPAVDDPFVTTSDTPLFVKVGGIKCANCGKVESGHREGSECKNFEIEKVEPVQYRVMNKMFKKAVRKSSVERDIKQKYLRKSMLTRLAPEVGYEQLNNFARWKPGSSQAQHYVSLNNDELRSMVKEKFKGESSEGKKMIECRNCGSRNHHDNLECKKCHRPLNKEKSMQMEKADRIAEKLSKWDEEKLDKVEENMELLENPKEFIKEQMKELQ